MARCDRCGVVVRFDGIVEGHGMWIDSDEFRTCESLGGGEDTPAHVVGVSWDPITGTVSVDACPDCGAGSGVPCVWACSSNWDAPREGVG